ncbi:GspE/PulE family protein [Candidatus Hydrogenedentota bacterium]
MVPGKEKNWIGDVLVKGGKLENEHLRLGLIEQDKTGEALEQILLRQGYVREEAILQAVAEELRLEYLKLDEVQPDEEAVRLVPMELAYKHRVVPLAVENGNLTIAMADPADLRAIDDIKLVSERKVVRVVASESDVMKSIERFYGLSVEKMIEDLGGGFVENGRGASLEIDDLQRLAKEPTVVNLMNLIVCQAIEDRASDIHIEPFDDVLKVKYRIDGVLHEMPPPRSLQAALTR